MARIMMKKAHNESISEAFEGFMLSAQSRGLTNKTLIYFQPNERKEGGAYITVTGKVRRIDEVTGVVVFEDERMIFVETIIELI